jgi:hypothetical protein
MLEIVPFIIHWHQIKQYIIFIAEVTGIAMSVILNDKTHMETSILEFNLSGDL